MLFGFRIDVVVIVVVVEMIRSIVVVVVVIDLISCSCNDFVGSSSDCGW